MKIDISNLFCATLPRSVCLSPLHSSPSHSCTRATCTSVSQWPVKTGSHSDSLAFVCVVCHKSEESADCVTVFFLPAQLGNMIGINTPMFCLAQHRDQVLCKKKKLGNNILLSKGVVLIISCQLGEGGHEAPKSAVGIPAH